MNAEGDDALERMEEGEAAALGSDSSPDEADQRNAEEIARLEQALREDPFHYDSHLQLIALLKDGDDLDRLREAREAMSKLFPLTPQLWLEWIRSEANLCLDDDEKTKVLELFQRAVKDYTSVELWLEYCQFCIGLMGSPGGMDLVRAVFEEACNKVGLHVTHGALIFEAYREFELALYYPMAAELNAGGVDEKRAEEIESQKQRVVALLRRQLAVPLLGMEKTLEEYKAFCENKTSEDNMMLQYNKALRKLEAVLPFEDSLVKDSLKAADYEPYLNYEIKEGDAARVQLLFERAILDDCLNTELWDKYVKYLDFTLKIDSLALPVHERSVRNCPWSSALWVSYLTCLEKLQSAPAKIQSVVDDAFQVGYQSGADNLAIWMFHISWIRRQIDFKLPQDDLVAKLRNCFEKAREHLSQFPDTECVVSILQYWARMEAKLGSLPQAREVWNLVTRQGAASDAQTWLDYAAFERTFGDDKHYRKVLQRGLYAAVDWPETLGEMWIRFEREEGSLEGLLEAQAKYESRMKIVNERRRRAADREALKESPPERSRREKERPSDGKQHKRKAQKDVLPNAADEKKGKWEQIDSEGFKVPLPVKGAPVRKSEDEDAKVRGVAPPERDALTDAHTVFLSNLAYEVQEESILEVFKSVGEVDELRLVRDYKKRCKGFGYLVFKSMSSVDAALLKDRTPIDGRPVFVSRLNERKQFAFRTELEKNKLFVKNVPFDATKEELQSLFEACGEVTDVRMCTLRNGKFKGMAYVDFADEAAASAAVVKYDGYELRTKSLSVAISNPPSRQPEKDKSLVAPQQPKGSTMKSRLFVPRALQVKARSQTAAGGDQESTSETAASVKPRSNADFRNMLVKQ